MDAVNVADAPAHCGFVPPVWEMETVGVTFGFTVIVIPPEVAVGGLAHARLDVSMQVTVWPLISDAVVNVLLFVPALPPFTIHWYEGVVPPFNGVAVNVADAPAHCGLVPEVSAIETDGVTAEFTAIVMLFDETVGEEDPTFRIMFGRSEPAVPVVLVHAVDPLAPSTW